MNVIAINYSPQHAQYTGTNSTLTLNNIVIHSSLLQVPLEHYPYLIYIQKLSFTLKITKFLYIYIYTKLFYLIYPILGIFWACFIFPIPKIHHYCRSSGGRVVKLLACGARGPGFDSRPRHLNFQRLVISCLQVEIWLKYR